MPGDNGEKTEQPTGKRLRDERNKGNIAKSQEVPIVASIMVSFFTLNLLGPGIMQTLEDAMSTYFGRGATVRQMGESDLVRLTVEVIVVFCKAAMPMLLVGMLSAVLVTLCQTRLLFTREQMKFKLSKLNPISGIKKMFSVNALVTLLKSLIKIIILGVIVYAQFYDKLFLAPRLMDMPVESTAAFIGEFVLNLVTTVCSLYALVAIVDHFYQKFSYTKKLRMSKQEVKEEYKNTEGDPAIKGKIKQKQREMAMARMMQGVPDADVVIRNPTHYAVALGYDPEKHGAPVVLAKGADFVALRIIKIAEENNVVIVENRPLARGLYESVELQRQIPEQYYQAVAEVLAFVYNMKHKKPKLPTQSAG